MNTVKKLKATIDEEVPARKVTKPKKEEASSSINSLLLIRLGVGIIFLMVILMYFFFSG